MPAPLSVVHFYAGAVTMNGTDGEQVAETADGNIKILLAAERGTVSDAVPVAARTTGANCYIVVIKAGGASAAKVSLSLNGVDWSNKIMFNTITNVNSIFYVRYAFAENEPYIDDLAIYLTVNYYAGEDE